LSNDVRVRFGQIREGSRNIREAFDELPIEIDGTQEAIEFLQIFLEKANQELCLACSTP
jgi:hypothetical protein